MVTQDSTSREESLYDITRQGVLRSPSPELSLTTSLGVDPIRYLRSHVRPPSGIWRETVPSSSVRATGMPRAES